jgi:hypothetical protein
MNSLKQQNHKITLSASKIKTIQSCSWLYWSKYHLKLPDIAGLGALSGSVCHTIFECLGNPRHKKHYDKIVKKGMVSASKPVKKLVLKLCRKSGIHERDDITKIGAMILAGLYYDFFGRTRGIPTKAVSEEKFDLDVHGKDVSYRIVGFIDKLFLYKKKSLALIRDFKSSKKMFEGKDVDDNIQAQIYALAIRKLYPEYIKNMVEFAFLQFMDVNDPEKGVSKINLSDADELDGLEYILTELQRYAENFTEKDATENMAYYKGFPTDGSFSGKLACGFNKVPGQLKKDGTPMWGCPFKFAFEYYSVKDKDGKILKTYSLDQEDLIEYDESKGQQLFIEKYNGCPAWNRK